MPMPESVSTTNQLKTFWARPEGKTGIALLAGAAVLGIYGYSQITGFLVGMLVDTVHIIELGGIVVGSGWVVLSKRSHMMFRLLSRSLTGIIINIDPIGIVEDKIKQMKKRREQFAQQISFLAGQKRMLEDTISQNEKDAKKALGYAAEARKLSQGDAAKAHDYQLEMRAKANKAGRLQESNLTYQQILTRVSGIYDYLCRFAANLDYFISDTEDEVQQRKIRYKVANAAWGAVQKAMLILKGNADENDIYDRGMEKLANDASEKLGYIDDFQRAALPFMTSMDIQNGVIDTAALAQLDQYEQKLLTSGDGKTAFLLPGAATPKAAAPVKGVTDTPSNYKNLLK